MGATWSTLISFSTKLCISERLNNICCLIVLPNFPHQTHDIYLCPHTFGSMDQKKKYMVVIHFTLWSSWTEDHPQEDLAKFSYKWDMNVKKFKHISILLFTTYWNMTFESGNIFFFLTIWQLKSQKSTFSHSSFFNW